VNPDDIKSYVARMANSYNISPEKLSAFIASDQERLYKVSYDIMTEKTLDKILEHIKVKELEKEEYERAVKELLEKLKATSAEEVPQVLSNEARGGNDDASSDSDRTDG